MPTTWNTGVSFRMSTSFWSFHRNCLKLCLLHMNSNCLAKLPGYRIHFSKLLGIVISHHKCLHVIGKFPIQFIGRDIRDPRTDCLKFCWQLTSWKKKKKSPVNNKTLYIPKRLLYFQLKGYHSILSAIPIQQ